MFSLKEREDCMFLSSLMRNVGNKMTLKLQYICLYTIHLAYDIRHWFTLVNRVINVRVLKQDVNLRLPDYCFLKKVCTTWIYLQAIAKLFQFLLALLYNFHCVERINSSIEKKDWSDKEFKAGLPLSFSTLIFA